MNNTLLTPQQVDMNGDALHWSAKAPVGKFSGVPVEDLEKNAKYLTGAVERMRLDLNLKTPAGTWARENIERYKHALSFQLLDLEEYHKR